MSRHRPATALCAYGQSTREVRTGLRRYLSGVVVWRNVDSESEAMMVLEGVCKALPALAGVPSACYRAGPADGKRLRSCITVT